MLKVTLQARRSRFDSRQVQELYTTKFTVGLVTTQPALYWYLGIFSMVVKQSESTTNEHACIQRKLHL
jgi:hypothetical protein